MVIIDAMAPTRIDHAVAAARPARRRGRPAAATLAALLCCWGIAAAPARAQDAPPSPAALDVPSVAPCSPYGLNLAWAAATDDVAVVRYEVLLLSLGPGFVAGTVVAASPQPPSYAFFLDGDSGVGLAPGTTYTLAIRTVDSSGQTTVGNAQTVTMPARPAAVAGLAGRFDGASVVLTWAAPAGACAIVVRREGEAIATLPAGATSVVDRAAIHGRSTYAVEARGHRLGATATIVLTEPLPAIGGRPTCAFRDTPLSARRLVEVSVASICLLNRQRVLAGLQPVWVDARLNAAALGHARDEVARNFFGHVNPDGCDPSCRAVAAGYAGAAAENIYAGVSTATDAVDGWMRSSGHRTNILSSGYRTMGSGTAVGGLHGRQWVHTFGFRPAPLTAVSGLEPQFQGAANPDAAGRPTAGGRSAKSPAGLRVRSARITRAWRLRVSAAITRRANGGRVRIRVRGRGATVTYRVRIANGSVRLSRTLPRRVRARRMTVALHYAGSSRVRSATVTLRLR